jgi:hypothetical protein
VKPPTRPTGASRGTDRSVRADRSADLRWAKGGRRTILATLTRRAPAPAGPPTCPRQPVVGSVPTIESHRERSHQRRPVRADRRSRPADDRRALQEARHHLPLVGDLRRVPFDVGLRAARRGAQGERQAAVVAFDGAAARRHRRSRRVDPHAPQGLGGVRAPRELRRSAGRVRRVPQARTCRPPPRGIGGELPRRGRLPVVWRQAHGPEELQPDVQDLRGAGGGRQRCGLAASRDGAGDVRRLPDDPALEPPEGALRDRADGQVVPQRDHARQLHLPHPRVRADGDGVLRRARHRRGVAPVLDRRADGLVHRPRDPAREPAAARARPRGDVALRQAHRRHRVLLPRRLDGVVRARGARQPDRLRPAGAREGQRAGPDVLRPGQRPPLPPLRHRAGGGRHPCDARVPLRRLPGRAGPRCEG